MADAAHQMLIDLSGDGLLAFAAGGFTFFARFVDGSIGIEGRIDQSLGFVDAFGNGDLDDPFPGKAIHFDLDIGGDDNAFAVFDFRIGQRVFDATGTVGFDFDGDAHLFGFVL